MNNKDAKKPDIQFIINNPEEKPTEEKQNDEKQNEAKPEEKNVIEEKTVPKGEIISETKEKVKKELTKEEKAKRAFTINAFMIVLLIIGSLIGYLYFKNLSVNGIKKPDPSSSDQKSSSQVENNDLTITDPKVSQFMSLFSYEEKDIKTTFPSIYSTTAVESSKLTLDHQLSIALFDLLETAMSNNTYAACTDLVSTSFVFGCDSENNALIDGSKVYLYQFSSVDLLSSYKRIFGNQTNYVDKNFDTASGITCAYNTNYFCLKKDTDVAGIETVSYVTKAYEYEDRMEIYTKYLWLEGENGYSNVHHDQTYFNNYYSNPASSTIKNIQENYEKQIKNTKHIFIKNNEGNYYWQSSQIVEGSN